MSMFNLFKEDVISYYEQIKSQGGLSVELENPSPAKLKSYILVRFNRGDLRADKDTLEEIFNAERRYTDLETAIDKFETDKFRALQYLMIGRTSESKEPFIKLLAIIIDFQPRPFSKWREDYQAKSLAQNLTSEPTQIEDHLNECSNEGPIGESQFTPRSEQPPVPHEEEKNTSRIQLLLKPFLVSKNRFKLRAAVITLLVTGIFTTVYYLTPKQCMCWVKDQYIAVDCSDKSQLNEIIATDDRIEYFKKIMRPDTLTTAHVNRVWYSKINHEVEFFTNAGSGSHPTIKSRSLKAATAHILEKYAGKNANLESIE